MISRISSSVEHSVFFCRKALSNDTFLTVRSDLQPIIGEHRCGYRFSLELINGTNCELEQIDDVTNDQHIAEGLFDILVSGDVYPCHLCDVAEDYLNAFDTLDKA